MVLALIPLFNYVIYPLLAKCNLLKTPLQKMSCGMFISASAFVVSGFLQLAVEKGLTETPSYYSDTAVVFVNGDCSEVQLNNFDDLWSVDYEKSLKKGERTATHDDILDLENTIDSMEQSR